MTTKHNWEKIKHIPDGHKFFISRVCGFKAPEQCACAIADDSGTNPENTDDGIIWLDFTRPISMGDSGYSIPVRSDSDHKSLVSSPASAEEALWMATYWGFPIEHKGKKYNITARK
jgi:hypothetical protein